MNKLLPFTSMEDQMKELNYVESSDEEEEALSLCDFPVNNNSKIMDDKSSLPDSSNLFNGFTSSSSSSDMCPADDIIFCGKLIPFKDRQQIKMEINKQPPRPDSVSSVIRSNSVSTCGGASHRILMRNSRSLNYASEVDRNTSAKKPRWYSLVFGTMKVPPEMELNDIKNRHVRRNPSTSRFPGSDSGKVSWRILKALSCKDHSSVAVTTSFAGIM